MLIFRKPFTRLIDRTRRVTRTGLEADAPLQDAKSNFESSTIEGLLRRFDNSLLNPREEQIRKEFEKQSEREQEREKLLFRVLATTSLVQQFDRTYFWIWGSQIAVLQFLNSLGTIGSDQEVTRLWYDQAKARDPEVYESYSFDKWLAFLENHHLVRRTAITVAITLEGREFLKFLADQGYPLYKSG